MSAINNGEGFFSAGAAGSAPVDSVNGKTGVVVLDQDDVLDGTNNKQFSSAEQTKLASLTNLYGLNALSTGLHEGGALSINGGDNTKFDISLGHGFVVDNATDPDNPTFSDVNWTTFTAVTVTNIATQPVTYISIDSVGAIVQSSTLPDATGRRANIFLGVIVHSDNVTVNAVNNLPTVGYDVNGQLQDLMNSMGFRSEEGNLITPNGANLNIDKRAGIGFKPGANFQTLNTQPHQFIMPLLTAATFRYRNQDSSEGANTTLIDPTTYDNGGTTTTVPSNNNATLQRVYIFPSNLIRIQRGQEVFANLSEAINASGKESFVVEDNIAENGLFLGSIAVKKTATDLSDTSDAKFIPAASISGAVGSTTTLQQAYDVSTEPEILTDSILGAVTVRRGSAADTDDVFQVENGAGTKNASITGEGNISCKDIFVDGVADVIHTASESDDHAVEIICDAAGFGDVKAVDFVYTTGAISSGQDEEAILLNIDESASNGGTVNGYEVLTTSTGSASINGYVAGVQVNPILQESGSFKDMDYARFTTSGGGEVDCLTDFITPGAGTTMFTADNDYIIVGDASQFSEIEFILSTVSDRNIRPTIQYSTGGSGFTTFNPTDGTNGFRNTGIIAWLPGDISGSWATNASGNYEIKIIRTRNGAMTPPVEDFVQISEVTEYSWNKDGDVNIKGLTVTDTISGSINGNASTVTTNANLTGDVTSTGNATTISSKAVDISMLADGTDGELITWDATGKAATVPVGTATHVLTSNGAGAAPTFQAPAAGGGASALFSARRGSNQTIADLTSTTVEFDTELFDTGSDFDTGTYTYTAPSAGKYMFTVSAYGFGLTAGDVFKFLLLKNGSSIGTSNVEYTVSTDARRGNTWVVDLASSDAIKINCLHDHGSNITLGASAEYTFSGYKLA
jgi:hypothetical protein